MIGFNRRFSPLSIALKKSFDSIAEPKLINIRVNAGFIPKEHWIQQAKAGGGRIIGEMCHFIDLMQFFTDAQPVSVYAASLASNNAKEKNDDNIAIIVKFSDGSIGNLTYLANGDKAMPKENIEVFSGGKIGVINDFRNGALYANNKMQPVKAEGKGHKQEVLAFLNAISQNEAEPISAESILYTTMTTFRIIDSLVTGMPQAIQI